VIIPFLVIISLLSLNFWQRLGFLVIFNKILGDDSLESNQASITENHHDGCPGDVRQLL